MHTEPFQIFGAQHLITLTIAAILILGIPFALRNTTDTTKHTAKIVLATLMLGYEIRQISYAFEFNYGWAEAFPFHMCDLSAFALSYFFFKGGRILFNCAFFWGVGGATMALITPDAAFAYPNPQYLPFFYSHTLLLVAVFFTLIALKERPYLSDIPKVMAVTLAGMFVIYGINFVLGDGANFWYLRAGPDAVSLMAFLPEPPFHVLAFIPLVILIFYLTYLPFWVWDRFTRSAPATHLHSRS